MPRKVERLAGDALTSPVRITVGEVGGANEDIKQVSSVWVQDGIGARPMGRSHPSWKVMGGQRVCFDPPGRPPAH